jgi:protein-tyrosine phosphatase
MTKILFVCLGNICRSPVAEGIMLHLNQTLQLGHEIDSAGTAGYHIGDPPDPRTIENALKHGIDLRALRARRFSVQDFEYFDSIYVMDRNNLRDVLRLSKSDKHRSKVSLLLDLLQAGSAQEVPDPYYGSEQDFEEVFQLVYQACSLIK